MQHVSVGSCASLSTNFVTILCCIVRVRQDNNGTNPALNFGTAAELCYDDDTTRGSPSKFSCEPCTRSRIDSQSSALTYLVSEHFMNPRKQNPVPCRHTSCYQKPHQRRPGASMAVLKLCRVTSSKYGTASMHLGPAPMPGQYSERFRNHRTQEFKHRAAGLPSCHVPVSPSCSVKVPNRLSHVD